MLICLPFLIFILCWHPSENNQTQKHLESIKYNKINTLQRKRNLFSINSMSIKIEPYNNNNNYVQTGS